MITKKHNIIQCVGIALLVLILMIMGYAIKSKQEQIKSLESANTALKTHNTELENENKKLCQTVNELNNVISSTEEDMDNIETYAVLSSINFLKDEDKYTWFKLYYHTLFEQYDLDDLPETPYDVFTDEQINIMLKCIETEAHEASFEAKCNVASVILNRVENDEFPIDPIKIVTGENQFAYGRDNIEESTRYALLYSFMIEDTTNGCIAFRSDSSVTKEWNGWTKQFTDESGHTFYK